MTGWIQDVRIAWRQAHRRPGSTLLLVAILALGMGSATAMFSVLRPVLLQSVPYADPDRLVYVWETDLANGEQFGGASFPDLADWRKQARTLASFGAYARDNATVRLPGGSPQRMTALNATHDLQATLAVQPLHGRGFVRDDDRVGAAPVVMLSHDFWRRSFGADPGAVGRVLDVDGRTAEIIGVMPPGGPWALGGDLWRPIEPVQNNFVGERGVHSLRVIARLEPDASIAQADAEMKSVMAALEQAHPDDNKGRSSQIVPMHAFLVRNLERPLWLLGATILVVLLLTCSNAAALLLARTSVRETEMAVRGSLGASRGRLLAQLAIECLTIAALGAGAGLVLAQAMLGLAAALNPVPELDPSAWRIDGAVLGFALAACVVSAVLAGTMPAWLCAHVSPARSLGAARGAIAAGGAALRRVLVSVQVAIALLLLLGVGVLLRSYERMSKVDLGVRAEGVATLTLGLPPGKYPMPALGVYPEWPQVARFMDALSERVNSVPGVESFGMMVHAPLASAWTTSVEVEGRDVPADAHEEWEMQAYSPGTLRTLGVPLLRGRDLGARDVRGTPEVVLINDAAARKYFPGLDPVGRRVRFWGTWREVIGVVGDVLTNGVTEPAAPALHPPLAQTPFSTFSVVARTSADPATLVPALRNAVWAVDDDVVPYGEGTVADRVAQLTAPQRFTLSLSGLLALLGVVLAVSGLVGTIAVDVQRRRGEIGVRMALGARARQVLATIMTRSMALVAIGMVAGVVVFLLAAPALEHFAFGVAPRDPAVIALALALFTLSAALASFVPARRALAIEPMQVLRSE